MDDERLDELYGADPEGFVARRDALAKELRVAGDREGAAKVKALRRPSQAAAILNRLARERRAELRAVLDAGSELAAAQVAAVGGKDGGGDALRGAQRALRAAIDGLVADATRGQSGAVADKVRGTLHAAASDDDLRAVVAAGRLDREVSPTGFGGLGGLSPQSETPARRPPGKRRDAAAGRGGQSPGSEKAEAAKRKKEEAAARQRAERRRKELRDAKEAEAAAEQELEAATAALAQVEASLKARRKDVADAEKRAERARQRRARIERDG